MTKKELERLTQLEDQAISTALDKMDFDPTSYLNEDDGKEYCRLYNKQFDEKNCVCGAHPEWQ